MRLIKQSNVNKRIKYQSTKQVLLLSAWLLGSVCEEVAVLTFHGQATDKLPTGYRHITNSRPTVGPLSAGR